MSDENELDELGLTEAEKEALVEEQTDEEATAEEGGEKSAAQGDEGAESSEADPASEEEKNTESEETGEKEAAASDSENEADGSQEEKEEKEEIDTGRRAPVYQAEPTDELQDQLKSLNKKYDEGDIEFTEYLEQRDSIRDQIKEQNILEKVNAQQREHQWQEDQRMFFSENPQYSNPMMMGALQGVYSDQDFMEKHGDKSGYAILREAKKVVDSTFNQTDAKPDKGNIQDPTDKQKREALKGRGKQQENMPQTLTDVPAASQDAPKGKYSELDNLEGMALEAAISKMSESEVEEYLSGVH